MSKLTTDASTDASTDATARRRGRSNRSGVRPPEELDPPGDPISVARTICLQQLATRPRSRAELATVLARRGVPVEAANPVLDRYTELGLIDDLAYADSMVRSQHAGRGLSRRAVAINLRKRGISDEDAEPALASIDDDSEFAAAQRLAAKKLRSLSGLDQATQSRRLFGLLARRGYSSAVAAQVVRDAVAVEVEGGVSADFDSLG